MPPSAIVGLSLARTATTARSVPRILPEFFFPKAPRRTGWYSNTLVAAVALRYLHRSHRSPRQTPHLVFSLNRIVPRSVEILAPTSRRQWGWHVANQKNVAGSSAPGSRDYRMVCRGYKELTIRRVVLRGF